MHKKRESRRTGSSSITASVGRDGTNKRVGDTQMRFLFRLTFWLAVVTLLLPRTGSQSTSNVGVSEAVSAAQATVSDMRGFCDRQPNACAVGSQTAIALGQGAQVGAKFVYDYLNERLGSAGQGYGMAATPEKRFGPHAGHDTLLPADRTLGWRGPQPHREARLDRRPRD